MIPDQPLANHAALKRHARTIAKHPRASNTHLRGISQFFLLTETSGNKGEIRMRRSRHLGCPGVKQRTVGGPIAALRQVPAPKGIRTTPKMIRSPRFRLEAPAPAVIVLCSKLCRRDWSLETISAEGANPPGIAQAKGRQSQSKLWREVAHRRHPPMGQEPEQGSQLSGTQDRGVGEDSRLQSEALRESERPVRMTGPGSERTATPRQGWQVHL